MVGPVFTATDFATAFQKLLPRGKAWPRDPDAVQTQFWMAMAPTYQRQTAAALALLLDSPAFQLNQMLPEWEAALGLPDICAGPNPSLEQRVAQVVAKFTLQGGQSVAYFIALAAKIGYPGVTITQYAPARAGRSHCGDPLCGPPWAHTWLVTAPTIPVFYAACGISRCGDPLYDLGANELECTINRYAPAHTIALYAGHA